MDTWQPIETAPKDRFKSILVWCPYAGLNKECHGWPYVAIWGYPNEDDDPCWIDPADCEKIGEPTLWMPITEPTPISGR